MFPSIHLLHAKYKDWIVLLLLLVDVMYKDILCFQFEVKIITIEL